MLLKPGWIIALLMFWFLTQLTITIGDSIVIGSGDINTAIGQDGQVIEGGLAGSQAPMMVIINQGVSIIQNPIAGIASLATNWGTIMDAVWSIMFFQADFLTGSWYLVSVLLTCIYAGFSLAFVVSFVQRL